MKLYFVHSLSQTSPRLWEYMPIDGLMVSADDVARSGTSNVKGALGFEGRVVVDSGGYRALSLGRIFEAEDILRWQELSGADQFIVLDYPLTPDLPAEEARDKIKASLENTEFWLDAFGARRMIPVVHGRSAGNSPTPETS